jgi:hypothetical protein
LTDSIGTLSTASAGPDNMVKITRDRAFRITKPLT